METIEGFGKRLKDLRLERDMSLDMVVYDINQKFHIEINKGLLSRWENDKTTPNLRLVRYLCMYYNVNLDYLIGLSDVKAPVRVLAREGLREAEA